MRLTEEPASTIDSVVGVTATVNETSLPARSGRRESNSTVSDMTSPSRVHVPPFVLSSAPVVPSYQAAT